MISVIIPVKNDRHIVKTLRYLNKIPKPEKTEIIVVDASKKETLLDIKKKFPKVRWFYYENKKEKKVTIPEQMNLGLKKSKGDLIAIIGADCKPEKNWLIELYSSIQEGENYVTGRVKDINGGFYDKNWEDLSKVKYRNEAGSANTLFKKDILSKVGYFDETFDYGSDLEFTWKVINAGYKIRYNPKAIIFDDWGGLKQDIKRAINYGKAKINHYKKHKDKIKYLLDYNHDLYSIYTIMFFVYIISLIPISIFFPWYLLFVLIPFIKNIKYNPIRKMIFDFFWGYGFLKRLFEVIILLK